MALSSSLARLRRTILEPHSKEQTEDYVASLRRRGFRIVQACFGPVPEGNFMAPTLIDLGEVNALPIVDGAVRGPILHLVRWKTHDLGRLMELLNRQVKPTALGVYTRIAETAAWIRASSDADVTHVNQPLCSTWRDNCPT